MFLKRLWMTKYFDVAPEGTPSAGSPSSASPWFTGKVSDPEIIGHWQNLGWHDKPAEEIAQLATKAHREAQKYIGVPANQIMRLPANEGDSAGWKAVFQRLGAASEAKDYDFSGVKHAGDTPLDSNLDTALRAAMLEANLPKSQAPTIAKGVVKYLDGIKSQELSDRTAKIQEERAALEKNWGLNLVANKLVATNAAKALGVDPQTVEALENVLGYSKVMEMFRNIGSKIGEDKFISSPQGGQPGVMTKDQAVARRAELMADTEWRKSYLSGDSQKAKEMTALIALIAG